MNQENKKILKGIRHLLNGGGVGTSSKSYFLFGHDNAPEMFLEFPQLIEVDYDTENISTSDITVNNLINRILETDDDELYQASDQEETKEIPIKYSADPLSKVSIRLSNAMMEDLEILRQMQMPDYSFSAFLRYIIGGYLSDMDKELKNLKACAIM